MNANKVLNDIDSILGVIDFEEIDIDDEIEFLIKERNAARKNKEWDKADKVRLKLDQMGIVLEDTPNGTVWKKKQIYFNFKFLYNYK